MTTTYAMQREGVYQRGENQKKLHNIT